MLIRHSAVNLRRAKMDRAPEDLGVRVRENLCLWSMSGAARNETWLVDDNFF